MTRLYRYMTPSGWSEFQQLSELLKIGLPGDTKIWWSDLCPNNTPAEQCSHIISIDRFYVTRPWRIIWCKFHDYEKYLFAFVVCIAVISTSWHLLKNKSDNEAECRIKTG